MNINKIERRLLFFFFLVSVLLVLPNLSLAVGVTPVELDFDELAQVRQLCIYNEDYLPQLYTLVEISDKNESMLEHDNHIIALPVSYTCLNVTILEKGHGNLLLLSNQTNIMIPFHIKAFGAIKEPEQNSKSLLQLGYLAFLGSIILLAMCFNYSKMVKKIYKAFSCISIRRGLQWNLRSKKKKGSIIRNILLKKLK